MLVFIGRELTCLTTLQFILATVAVAVCHYCGGHRGKRYKAPSDKAKNKQKAQPDAKGGAKARGKR